MTSPRSRPYPPTLGSGQDAGKRARWASAKPCASPFTGTRIRPESKARARPCSKAILECPLDSVNKLTRALPRTRIRACSDPGRPAGETVATPASASGLGDCGCSRSSKAGMFSVFRRMGGEGYVTHQDLSRARRSSMGRVALWVTPHRERHPGEGVSPPAYREARKPSKGFTEVRRRKRRRASLGRESV